MIQDIESLFSIKSEKARKSKGDDDWEKLRLIELGKGYDRGENWEVIHDDFRTVDIAEGSVDAIVTDPPYEMEYFDLVNQLAPLAKKWLRDGGLLIMEVGQLMVVQLRPFTEYLNHFWTFMIDNSSRNARMYGKKLYVTWKPLVVFSKGNYEPLAWISDRITSTKFTERTLHKWQQSEDLFDRIIDLFTEPGFLVLDPFCGSGTTGVSCLKKGRRFIGIDIDEESALVARGRLRQLETERGEQLELPRLNN